MIQIQFSRDATGSTRIVTPKQYESLAKYLRADVQAIPDRCQYVIALADEVKSGKKKESEDIGNAWILTLNPTTARIQSQFVESEKLKLPIGEFHQVLKDWLAFIKK